MTPRHSRVSSFCGNNKNFARAVVNSSLGFPCGIEYLSNIDMGKQVHSAAEYMRLGGFLSVIGRKEGERSS